MFVVGVFFTDELCILLGANGTYHQMARDYIFWYSIFLVPSALLTVFNNAGRNDGAPGLVCVANVISTVFNIFGDWLFIFPLQMGMAGAAIATGLSQTLAAAMVAVHFLRKRGKLRIQKFRYDAALMKEIFFRGTPECISQFGMPLSTICMNWVLLSKIGEIGVNSYSIIMYVASFSMAVFFSTAVGLQPLIGQAYGAREEKDMKYYFHAGLVINFIGSIIIYIGLFFVAEPICLLFGADGETSRYTLTCMPLFAWGFSVMAFNLMIAAYLYSTKRSKEAIILNALRAFGVNILIIVGLPMIFPPVIIWHTFGIYEGIALVAAVVLLKGSERGGVRFY